MTALILPFRPRGSKPCNPSPPTPSKIQDTPQPDVSRGDPPWHHGRPVVVDGEQRTFCRTYDVFCDCGAYKARDCGRRGGL